jgi:hypothetical protein
MKKCVYFIVILATLIFVGSVNAATYYVGNTGNDSSGIGDANRPWRTIAHALSLMKSGDLIKINDGTYNEGQLNVPPGVSLTSTSQDSSKVIIQPNTNLSLWQPFINLSSTNPGSIGQQTISYLDINGNSGIYHARRGIYIQNRSNVKVDNCNIRNFTGQDGSYGVFVLSNEIQSTSDWWNYWPIGTNWPANPVENFELSNCIITNCGYRQAVDSGGICGAVRPFNLKNSSIHHNVIDTTVSLGKGIHGTMAFLDNVDVYDNEITTAHYTDRSIWSIELWTFRNGCEIYNNKTNTPLSITGGDGTKVHDNKIVIVPSGAYQGSIGIEFIGQSNGEVYNNYIENARHYGIDVGLEAHNVTNMVLSNVKIYKNIIYNCLGYSIGIVNLGNDNKYVNHIVENIDVFNNICDDLRSDLTYVSHIIVRSKNGDQGISVTRNINIKQNILINSPGYAGKTLDTVTNLVIDENLYWNNYKDSWMRSTTTNTIIEDPRFEASGDHSREYYNLKPDSPMWEAFNSGVAIEPPSNVRVVNN